MTTPHRVGIVGAGISGLAHAQVLREHGFDVVVFEKGPRIGGVWALTYPDVTLQNTGDHYHLTAFPWPSPPDLHPTGTQINAYLAAAVEALDLDVRLEHEVVSAEPSGDGWALTVRHAGETTI